jgi:hypothetical protein
MRECSNTPSEGSFVTPSVFRSTIVHPFPFIHRLFLAYSKPATNGDPDLEPVASADIAQPALARAPAAGVDDDDLAVLSTAGRPPVLL